MPEDTEAPSAVNGGAIARARLANTLARRACAFRMPHLCQSETKEFIKKFHMVLFSACVRVCVCFLLWHGVNWEFHAGEGN